MFNKLAQEHPLAKENDLYSYHSGGGCFHFRLAWKNLDERWGRLFQVGVLSSAPR